MGTSLDEFVAAGPAPVRVVLRVLLPLARRPRGRVLLGRLMGADQAVTSVAALGHYDRPDVARSLGWDAEAVVARGRELRRSEGRP